MDINSAVGRKSGLRDEQLLALCAFEESSAFDEKEKSVLRLATHMTATPADIPEADRARFNRVFNVGSQNYSQGGVCVLHARQSA